MATAREMANWIFLWDDALSEIPATVIAAPAVTSGYSTDALLDRNRQTVTSFSDTGNLEIIFDLGANKTIYGYGIHNHNLGTKAAGNLTVSYSTNNVDWTAASDRTVGSDIGNDDFLAVFAASHSARYWSFYVASVDAAGLFVGRIYLARAMYEMVAPTPGPATGGTKGYTKHESVIMTPGGIEHRMGRALKRRVISAVVPDASTTVRGYFKALVEYCNVNDKCFVMSDPFGTTTYAAGNRYGAAIHARFNTETWQHTIKVVSLSDIPLDIIEVL